jgi:hypothetical protein
VTSRVCTDENFEQFKSFEFGSYGLYEKSVYLKDSDLYNLMYFYEISIEYTLKSDALSIEKA